MTRTTADRCPGVLRSHRAADGALVRLRVPGGTLSAGALERLTRASVTYADASIQLTSRANLQLRGIALDQHGEVPRDLDDAATQAGLLPSRTHERVRNIVASPLTGRTGGLADLRRVVRDLDRRLCASSTLAGLPGRFLFGLDDGRGDIAGMRCDLALRAIDAEIAQVVVGAGLAGPVVPIAEAAASLIALAERFLAARGDTWHVDELPERGAELLNRRAGWLRGTPPHAMPYGVLRQHDDRDAVSVLAPLGVLTTEQSRALVDAARYGSGDLVLTPWRGVVVPDLDTGRGTDVADMLAATGLVVDDGSPWNGLTACVGAPGCDHASADTREAAAQIAAGPRSDPRTHVVACERGCGAPAGPHTLVLAGDVR